MQAATDGAKPASGDKINAKYSGRLLDGTKFDSSSSFDFTVDIGQVIKCWDVAFMHLA